MILLLENVTVSYNKKDVLSDVSMRINEGEVVFLSGPNGAGKSTLLKVIAGMLIPKDGKIYFNEEEITHKQPYERINMGMAYLMQGGEIFPTLTVLENIKVGVFYAKNDNFKLSLRQLFTLFPSIEAVMGKRAGLLSGGEKQMLALGIVLIKNPKLLLLDEPFAGLAYDLVCNLTRKLKEINISQRTTILLVEQNVKEALSISQRIYLLKNGNIYEGICKYEKK